MVLVDSAFIFSMTEVQRELVDFPIREFVAVFITSEGIIGASFIAVLFLAAQPG
jgi:hypothetical protein